MAGSVLPQTLVPVGGDSAVLYAKHVRYVHINNLICIHIFYICILHVTNLFNQLSVKLSKLCVDYEIVLLHIIRWYVFITFLKAICSPTCENGGSCTAPGSCNCAPGYTGPSCSNGTVRLLTTLLMHDQVRCIISHNEHVMLFFP